MLEFTTQRKKTTTHGYFSKDRYTVRNSITLPSSTTILNNKTISRQPHLKVCYRHNNCTNVKHTLAMHWQSIFSCICLLSYVSDFETFTVFLCLDKEYQPCEEGPMLLRATVQVKRIQRERAMLWMERKVVGEVSGRFSVGHSFPHALLLMKNLLKRERERKREINTNSRN